jgi:hypothetical protein
MKFVIDLWLDGYEDDEEMRKACIEFIKESLDVTASSVKVYPVVDGEEQDEV